VAAPLATVIAVAAAVVLFGLPGLVLVAMAAAGGIIIAGAAARLLQGVTGDVYGAAIEVSQVVVWISLAAAAHREWISPLILD
jgi:cobalamin synthase